MTRPSPTTHPPSLLLLIPSEIGTTMGSKFNSLPGKRTYRPRVVTWLLFAVTLLYSRKCKRGLLVTRLHLIETNADIAGHYTAGVTKIDVQVEIGLA